MIKKNNETRGGTGMPLITKTSAQLTSAHQMRKMAPIYHTKVSF